MPKLIYLSLARFPTEKANGLQIAQNCEAFAANGYDVQLWVSGRKNTPQMERVQDPYAHYGIEKNFAITRIPILDLYPLANNNLRLEKVAFVVSIMTYLLNVLLRLIWQRADVYYSRDEYTLWVLSLFLPREKIAFEVHQFWDSPRTAWVQRYVSRRVGHIIAITPKLAEDIVMKHGADAARVFVAHDGIRAARFAQQMTITEARQQTGWPQDAFIVGYVGRLHMLNVDKGAGSLVEAAAQLSDVSVAFVGGPDEMVDRLKVKWIESGASPDRFLYAGQVKPEEVPLYLAAFDACAMPHPFTQQFAYYTSPLKLFEYMASARPVIASDLPGWSDVIRHDETAQLIPPGDLQALADAIQRLQDDPQLRERLGQAARERVFVHYTWAARAKAIRAHIERDKIGAGYQDEVQHG